VCLGEIHGIGSMLVSRGLEMLCDRSTPFVVVLGHPESYPRFGVEMASSHGLRSEWDRVPDQAFMVKVFVSDVFPTGGDVVMYRDEFDAAM
jgi:predicted N-acetyltransferase YhbS